MAVPDDFSEHLKQQILDAYGFDSEAELDAAIEEQLPGYLAAHAEWEAEKAAFTAELQGRMEEATAAVTAWGQAHGILPDGVELVPMDLQADAQWLARAPWTQKPNGGLTWTEVPMATRPAPWTPEKAQAQREQMAAAFDALGQRIAEQWTAMGPALAGAFDQIVKNVTAAGLALQKLGFAVQFRDGARSCPHRPLYEACDFCYPKSFPAARDYRRRTKHRRKRQR